MSEHVSSFFAELLSKGDITEEQWAAHDARVRESREREEREKAERERNERLMWMSEEVCVPAKDIDLITADGGMVETKALRAVREGLREGHRIIVLSGTRGSGKTTAAAWYAVQNQPRHEYLRTQWQYFIDANQLSRYPRYDEQKMHRLERALALVIDDLGVEYDDKQGNFRSLFDALVNARYAAMLPTVITTNLSAEQFKERYGERVADRIREVGRFVSIADESLRGRK